VLLSTCTPESEERRAVRPRSIGFIEWVLITVLAFWVGGCAGLPGILRDRPGPAEPLADAAPSSTPSAEVRSEGDAGREPGPAAQADGARLAQQTTKVEPFLPDVEIEEYDPWEPFNEKTFEFNRALDRYLLKPAAKGYNFVLPDRLQQMIGNGFDNIRFVPRVINSLLQGKVDGAFRELGRFMVNSTFGIGGLFDVATTEFGIEKSKEDAGQTLGFWGMGPGPYLVLPFLQPLTVRDGIGQGIDMFLDPLGYFLPFFWDRFGMKVGDTINDRSLNLELFQGFEETTVDLYSAVRNAYLQRRYQLIQE
jgi:phospholipid-binding lipoprotein MlaA